MGLPAAGKSTLARTMVDQGYTRLNRDEAGGSLRALLPALERTVAAGSTRIVLDNTYVSRAARAAVVQTASTCGLPVRCLWLATPLEDAQVNAVARMLSRHERLLDPEEIRKAGRRDAGMFGPGVQFRYHRELEPPELSEGFSAVDVLPFVRGHDPAFTNRALILWCDGVLRPPKSGPAAASAMTDATMRARGEVLRHYQRHGWLVFGLSWQPEITEDMVGRDEIEAGFDRMRKALGFEVPVEVLPPWRRTAGLLVSQAAAGARRRTDTAPPARPLTLHLRRRGAAGSGLCAPARLPVSGSRALLQWPIGAGPASTYRGLISRTRTMDTIATLAKMPKMPKSGTCRSRRRPKPQSAKPPQLMLTRFMIP